MCRALAYCSFEVLYTLKNALKWGQNLQQYRNVPFAAVHFPTLTMTCYNQSKNFV